MPTREGYAQGIPCWVDLAVSDVDIATGFYGPLLGWEFEAGEAGLGYVMAFRNGLPAAGIGALPDEETSPVWSTYFAVDDAYETSKEIVRAGGSLVSEPDDVADLGRMAFATDPTGARFGIWQAGRHFGAAIVNEHGGLNWNELVTDEPGRAIEFYTSVFGHGTQTASTPSGRDYTMLEVASREVAGIIAPTKPGHESEWTVYFAVSDASAASDTASEGGGKVLYGPIEQPDVGTFVGLRDPLGTRFTVIQLANEID